MHGTNRKVGNALSQLPTDRRRVDQKPFGAHPRSPEVLAGSTHGCLGQRYTIAGRPERIASQRNSGLASRVQLSLRFTRYEF